MKFIVRSKQLPDGTNPNAQITAKWVQAQIGIPFGWPECTSLALCEDGDIIAGVIFEGYFAGSINIHVAAIPGRRWMTRQFLQETFYYPFVQLDCHRLTGVVADSNEEAKRFDEHLGFVREGRIRKGAPDGTDLIIYGMLKEECRFLPKEKEHGQALAAASA